MRLSPPVFGVCLRASTLVEYVCVFLQFFSYQRIRRTYSIKTSILEFVLCVFHQEQYSRIRAAPFWVDCSQVSALSHKDVELSEPLHIVDGELDVSLNLHISKVPTVHGHHTSAQLGAQQVEKSLLNNLWFVMENC